MNTKIPLRQTAQNIPEILIFSTGGTIAMRAGEKGVCPTDAAGAGAASLLKVPGVNLREINFSNLPSSHMGLEKWLELAAEINSALLSPAAAGAVALHGTDLMPECAQTLDLCLTSEKPVVITGSMRAQGEEGYDGLRNLENAAHICLALPHGGEALVCMGDEIYSAGKVFKQHSVAPASMNSADGPLGRVVGNKVNFTRQPLPARPALFNPENLLKKPIPPVGLISAQAGDDGSLVDPLLLSGAQGLVVEGFGAGNLTPLLARRLKAAIKENIPVLVTTRCPWGGVHPIYVYEGGAKDLKNAGAILCNQSTASKAVLFLKMALASQFNRTQIMDFFN